MRLTMLAHLHYQPTQGEFTMSSICLLRGVKNRFNRQSRARLYTRLSPRVRALTRVGVAWSVLPAIVPAALTFSMLPATVLADATAPCNTNSNFSTRLECGVNSFATGPNSTAVGGQALASGDDSTAVGRIAEATAINSIAVGAFAEATGCLLYTSDAADE